MKVAISIFAAVLTGCVVTGNVGTSNSSAVELDAAVVEDSSAHADVEPIDLGLPDDAGLADGSIEVDAGVECGADDDCGTGSMCVEGMCTPEPSDACAFTFEICNGIDDDCNGVVDEGCP